MIVATGYYLRRDCREQIVYPPQKKETNLFLLIYNIFTISF